MGHTFCRWTRTRFWLPKRRKFFSYQNSILVHDRRYVFGRHFSADTLFQLALQSPHSANRHHSGSLGAGDDHLVAAVATSGLAVRLCFSVAEQTDRTYAEQ